MFNKFILHQVAKERIDDVSDLARKQLGGRGRDEQELPAHYYEWAATLSDLPPDQRATVLNTLPEDDRLHVQVSCTGKSGLLMVWVFAEQVLMSVCRRQCTGQLIPCQRRPVALLQ